MYFHVFVHICFLGECYVTTLESAMVRLLQRVSSQVIEEIVPFFEDLFTIAHLAFEEFRVAISLRLFHDNDDELGSHGESNINWGLFLVVVCASN